MCKSGGTQMNTLINNVRGGPWLALAGLLVMLLLLGGCTVLPVNAGEPPVMPVPVGNEQVIAIAPSVAASGTTIAVAGAGWKGEEVVYVNLEGKLDAVDLETTMVMTSTDRLGRFTTEFVAPLEIFWQGATDVRVVAYSLDKARRASAPFAFSPITATVPAPITPTPTSTATAATATPVPSAPTATFRPVTPVPTQVQPEGTARVTSSALNMRSGPGTNYPVIRTLPFNTLVVVLGQNFSGQWLYVQTYDLQLGWVARAYTNFSGSAPIINGPPTPIPPATWTPLPTLVPLPTFVPPPGGAWMGEYYANRFLSGYPTLVRQDATLDFNWGYGSPAPQIPADNFSVRWTRAPYFDEGTYRFQARSDDGVRIWVDGNLIIDQWHNWTPDTYVADIWLGAGYHNVVVDYYEETGVAFITVWWDRINPDYFPDWKGEYFTNRDLAGNPAFLRNDTDIDFNWGTSSPAPGIPSTNFSVRWTRRIDFSSGIYRLNARSDDGVRVFVDGNRVINAWRDSDYGPTHTAEVYLSGRHDVRVEYYQHLGGARVRFWWDRISRGTATPTQTPTNTPTLTPTPTNTPTATPTTPAPLNPYADVNPASGPAGTTVSISFGNFPPNTTVNLYMGGYANAVAAAEANANIYATTSSDRFGRGSLSFTIPANWPDGAPIQPGRLALLLATPNFGVTAAADFTFVRAQPTVAPRPYAEANPDFGGSGTVVTVRGGGFPANMTLNVFLAGVVRASESNAVPPVTSTVSDLNGNYVATFTMPANWSSGESIPTGKLVVLVAMPDFSVEASADFDYFVVAANPAVTLNPPSGGAGTLVTVNGTGYPANVNVGIFLAALDSSIGTGEPQRYATGRTDSNGRVTLSFAMPALWPNSAPIMQDQILVTLARLDFSVAASDVFAYLTPGPTWTPTAIPTTVPGTATPAPIPIISITPASGTAGSVVSVTGSGFPRNTTVYAHLAPIGGSGGSGNEYANYAVATTSGSGALNLAITMPAVWPNGTPIPSGRLVIQVATADFSSQASDSFDYRSVGSSSEEPTATPTAEISGEPVEVPTEQPIEVPTEVPTVEPTEEPTEEPTAEPTVIPATPEELPTPAAIDDSVETPVTRPGKAPTATPVPAEEIVVTEEPVEELPTLEPTATPLPAEEELPTAVPVEEPATATPKPPKPAKTTPTDVPPTQEPAATPVPPAKTPKPNPPTPTPVPPPPEVTDVPVAPPDAPPVEAPVEAPAWTPTATITTTLTITPLEGLKDSPEPIEPLPPGESDS